MADALDDAAGAMASISDLEAGAALPTPRASASARTTGPTTGA